MDAAYIWRVGELTSRSRGARLGQDCYHAMLTYHGCLTWAASLLYAAVIRQWDGQLSARHVCLPILSWRMIEFLLALDGHRSVYPAAS